MSLEGELIAEYNDHTGWLGWADFSPDDRHVLTTGQDGIANLYDVRTGKLVRTFEGHEDAIFSGFISPDSQTILTGSYDRTVREWDIASGQETRRILGHTDFVIAAYSPTGEYIATAGGDDVVNLWLGEPQVELAILVDFSADHFQDQTSVSTSKDARTVLVGRLFGSVELYDATTGALQQEVRFGTNQINAQDLSPDGQLLVSGDSNGSVGVWDLEANELVWESAGSGSPANAVKFSSDGAYVMVADGDAEARLLDSTTGEERQRLIGHAGAVLAITSFDDGKAVLTGGADGTARLWEAETGVQKQIFSGHKNGVRAAAMSPDYASLATASDDQTIIVWSVESGEQMAALSGHTGAVLQVAFSPDGQFVLSGSDDQTARLWEIESGLQIHQYGGHLSPVWMIDFSKDGRHVLTADSRAVFRRLANLDDLVALACGNLSRGFTDAERTTYQIDEGDVACVSQSAENSNQIEPTWTPVLATPAPKPIEIEFMLVESANVQMGFPVQHVYVAADDGQVQRPVELSDETLNLPLFNASIPISDTFTAPYNLGPFPKGEALGFTLAEWNSATGHGTYSTNGTRAQLELEFHGLVPNGVYTLWCVRLQFVPEFIIHEELPCGKPDGSENRVAVDDTGYGTLSLELDAFPLSTEDSIYELALAYHSDGLTHGASPGEYGKNLHAQMVFDFLPPEQ